MRLVASSEEVKIYCPSIGRISFFNSPYPAHHICTALDLYPGHAFGEAAPSPVMGRVVEIRRVLCPKGRHFQSSSFDYVILLESLENPNRLIKILHIKPRVEVGEVLEPGQELGVLLRSGYFDFWTDPHIHVEIRDPSDALRARGGFKIERLIRIDEAEPLEELKGAVVETKPEYFLISLSNSFGQGMPADVGGQTGILDAGIPHYGWIGAHTNDDPAIAGNINLCGRTIGTIKNVYGGMCLAKCADFNIRFRGIQVGLSLYPHLSSKPLIKIVPPKPGALKVERFEEVSLDII
ncbi:MAG: hypothetical protein ACE5NN_04385 [Candidatus Bathyarchaeia archaeon]